jgi:hypothetical protein
MDENFEGTQEQPTIAVDRSQAIIHAAWSATHLPATAAEPTVDSPTPPHAHGHTAPSGSRRAIHYATSLDGGKSFGPAIAIAPQDDVFQSRIKLAVGRENEVYAAYFELSSEGKRLVIGRIRPSIQSAKPSGAIAGFSP